MRHGDFYQLDMAVNFHKDLNPRLWDEQKKMHPDVRRALFRIAKDFQEFLGLDEFDLLDITVSGSNAAYTYTPSSDLDLHLVTMIPANHDQHLRELFNAKKYQYNDTHRITVKGIDVELYVQDAEQPHASAGVYSVLKNKWLRTPSRRKADIDDTSVREKFEAMKHRIHHAITSDDYDRIQAVWDDVKAMRRTGLTREGEFSPENLAYKILRAQGLIDKLTNHLAGAKSAELSIDEQIFESAGVKASSLPGAVGKVSVQSLDQFLGNLDAEDDEADQDEIDETTKLPIQQRDIDGQEFQDYLTRIVGSPDIDKKTGLPKINKVTGKEKYISGKTKTDKYKMPYIHRNHAIEFYDPQGRRFREEAVKQALAHRPTKLLKQNEKMKHSNGEFEQFFNIGFAALTGIALDESTNNLIVVNTCPGAGACKVDCFAMKGGKVQFENAWLSDGKILTYLLNNPDGFFEQLCNEIAKEANAGKKGDKKFPGGWQVTVRWHDAGDFFSPEYLDLALKVAQTFPDVKFYAYTKMAGAALAKKPDNFIINWSEGAHTSQEKQVKAADPNLERTKNSRIVPEKLFYDLLAKDAKGNLQKGAEGQWQVAGPTELQELKKRLAQAYNIAQSSILSYDEYMAKPKVGGMKYNVIVAPGEGDVSANDQNVLSTLLLRH